MIITFKVADEIGYNEHEIEHLVSEFLEKGDRQADYFDQAFLTFISRYGSYEIIDRSQWLEIHNQLWKQLL